MNEELIVEMLTEIRDKLDNLDTILAGIDFPMLCRLSEQSVEALNRLGELRARKAAQQARYRARKSRKNVDTTERVDTTQKPTKEKDGERTEEGKEISPLQPPIEKRAEEKKEEKKKERGCLTRARVDVFFADFWEQFPRIRRTDKKECRKKFAAIVSAEKTADRQISMINAILEGLKRWKQSKLWTKDDGAFVCAPLVWLRNERWADDVMTADEFAAQGKRLKVATPVFKHGQNWIGTPASEIQDVF